MKYIITARSINELGKRSNQEDSIFPQYSDQPSNGDLYILCDGMGGHAAGEVASQTVCEAMSEYINKHVQKGEAFGADDFNAALDAAYDALDAKDTDDEKKMGTTLTFVKFHSGGCFIAHIGDSRIYHIRPSEKRILHVTRDHSLVNDLIKLGELTPEEAKTSNQRNVITRAMQPNQESRTSADCINLTDLEAGDYIYMCSDGMLEQMENEEIVNILSLDRTDAEKIEILKGATKENKDNHSAHLIRIESVSEESIDVTPEEETEKGPEEDSRVQAPSSEDEVLNVEPVNKVRKSKRGLKIILLLIVLLIAGAVYYNNSKETSNPPKTESSPKNSIPEHSVATDSSEQIQADNTQDV